MTKTVREQFRDNLAAITSLGYETRRNKQSGFSRNARPCGLQMPIRPRELQEVLFYSRHDQDGLACLVSTTWEPASRNRYRPAAGNVAARLAGAG